MMVRPTRKAFALGSGALLLFLIGANIQAGWLYVLGASLLGAVAAGLAVPVSVARKVVAERRVPPVAVAGDEIGVLLTLRSPRTVAAPIEAMDHFLSGANVVAEEISTIGAVASYQVVAERRGKYEAAEVELSTSFPFGIGMSRKHIDVPSHLIVRPRWSNLGSFPLLEAASIPNEAIHDRRRRGAGLDFFGIREYRPGDSLRHVHWRSSARGGRLLVKEYEEVPASRLGLLLHSSEKFGSEPKTTFELQVSAAASIALYALDAGHPVQMFCDSITGMNRVTDVGREDLLDWLALVEADGRRSLLDAVTEILGDLQPRSTNVIVFPATKRARDDAPAAAALLQGASTRAVAVLVSTSTMKGSGNQGLTKDEEEELISTLLAARALVYVVDSERALSECLKEPRRS